jgi:hypothetical protein
MRLGTAIASFPCLRLLRQLRDPGSRDLAEKILMLCAFYKAGRWNLLKQMANSPLSLVIA